MTRHDTDAISAPHTQRHLDAIPQASRDGDNIGNTDGISTTPATPEAGDLVSRAAAVTAAASVTYERLKGDAREDMIYNMGFTAGRKAVEAALSAIPAAQGQEGAVSLDLTGGPPILAIPDLIHAGMKAHASLCRDIGDGVTLDRTLVGDLTAALARAYTATPAPVEAGLVEALRSGEQADMDGCRVKVSREAVEKAADILAALRAQSAPVGGKGGAK